MKKIIVGVVVCMSLGLVSKAQDDYSFGQGTTVITAGYGFPNLFKSTLKAFDAFSGSKTTGWGPVSLGFEYGVSERIGVGVQAGASSTTSKYDDGAGYKSEESLNALSILLRMNYHFANSPSFDPYLGIGAGYNNFKYKFKDNDSDPSTDNTTFSYPIKIAVTGAVGARYYPSSSFGIYAEVGYVAGAVLQAGVVLKLN